MGKMKAKQGIKVEHLENSIDDSSTTLSMMYNTIHKVNNIYVVYDRYVIDALPWYVHHYSDLELLCIAKIYDGENLGYIKIIDSCGNEIIECSNGIVGVHWGVLGNTLIVWDDAENKATIVDTINCTLIFNDKLIDVSDYRIYGAIIKFNCTIGNKIIRYILNTITCTLDVNDIDNIQDNVVYDTYTSSVYGQSCISARGRVVVNIDGDKIEIGDNTSDIHHSGILAMKRGSMDISKLLNHSGLSDSQCECLGISKSFGNTACMYENILVLRSHKSGHDIIDIFNLCDSRCDKDIKILGILLNIEYDQDKHKVIIDMIGKDFLHSGNIQLNRRFHTIITIDTLSFKFKVELGKPYENSNQGATEERKQHDSSIYLQMLDMD